MEKGKVSNFERGLDISHSVHYTKYLLNDKENRREHF